MRIKSIITLFTLIGLTSISAVSVCALPSNKAFGYKSTANAIISDVEDIVDSEISNIQTLADDVSMGMDSFAASASEILSPNEA